MNKVETIQLPLVSFIGTRWRKYLPVILILIFVISVFYNIFNEHSYFFGGMAASSMILLKFYNLIFKGYHKKGKIIFSQDNLQIYLKQKGVTNQFTISKLENINLCLKGYREADFWNLNFDSQPVSKISFRYQNLDYTYLFITSSDYKYFSLNCIIHHWHKKTKTQIQTFEDKDYLTH